MDARSNAVEDESIRIVEGKVIYYNGYGEYDLNIDEDNLIFDDNRLFPGWELKIEVKIHNDGSYPVYIDYEIYYSWDGVNWNQVLDPKDPKELYNEFRIVYDSVFHDEDGEPWDPDRRLKPCEFVINREHLIFDAQDRPDLQGKTFTIRVDIMGSMTK